MQDLTLLGFSIVFPRLSDIIGQRAAVLLAWVLFATFSLGAGLSKTLPQLIVCRAFQGIGGTGLYAMTMVISPQITPVKRWPLMGTSVGVVVGTAAICGTLVASILQLYSDITGPILGGVITEKSTWRWIYLFNAPFAAIAVLPLVLLWPRNNKTTNRQQWRHIDVFGALLSIAGSCLIVFVLNQVGAAFYKWNDAVIISCLTISGLCWVSFVVWIAVLSRKSLWNIDPIFPGKIAATRPSGPAIV